MPPGRGGTVRRCWAPPCCHRGRSLGPGDRTATQYLDESPRRLAAGIDLAELDLAVRAQSPHSSLLGVDAQVTVTPARPAAETFTAASYRAVSVSWPDARGRTVTRKFTSAVIIGRTVAVLNGAPVSIVSMTADCLGDAGPSLTLDPVPGQLAVHAVSAACGAYQIRVGGTPEPALDGRITQFATALFRRRGPG